MSDGICGASNLSVIDSPFQVWPGLYLLVIGRINNFLLKISLKKPPSIFLFFYIKRQVKRHNKVVKSSKGTLIPVMWTNQLLSRQSPCVSGALVRFRIPTGKCCVLTPSELHWSHCGAMLPYYHSETASKALEFPCLNLLNKCRNTKFYFSPGGLNHPTGWIFFMELLQLQLY